MIDKETEQEENLHVGRIRPTDLIVDDDANFEYHLNQDEFLRTIERNKKGETTGGFNKLHTILFLSRHVNLPLRHYPRHPRCLHYFLKHFHHFLRCYLLHYRD